MKTLLVTGISGLLGLNLGLQFHQKYRIIGVTNRMQLKDVPFETIQRDFFQSDAADRLLNDTQPDALIHCAAMANVDDCEKNPEAAMALNGVFPGKLATAAGAQGIPMLHISTDAVFDGKTEIPAGYTEENTPDPINTYAATKLAGERNVLEANADAIVARVNFYGWSPSGKRSLSEFFYNNLSEGKKVNGFTDVFFCPLYVRDLAKILEQLLLKKATGLYHVFSAENQSKFAFGRAIAELFGFDPDLVQPVSWRDGGLNAARSPYLIMNTDKLATFLNEPLPGQAVGLQHFYEDQKAGLAALIKTLRID